MEKKNFGKKNFVKKNFGKIILEQKFWKKKFWKKKIGKKKFGIFFFGKQICIGPIIRIGREIRCLPYAGFLQWLLRLNHLTSKNKLHLEISLAEIPSQTLGVGGSDDTL